MSIRRVADLPSLAYQGDENFGERFKQSFFEISYLSNDVPYQDYRSMKMLATDCVSAVADILYENPHFISSVWVNGGEAVEDLQGTSVIVNAGNVQINSLEPAEISALRVKRLSIENEYPQYSFHDQSQMVSSDGVNWLLMKKYVDDALADLSSKLSPLPLLTFVFSDHVIDSPTWRLAGEEVDLQVYTDLRAEVLDGDGNLKEAYRTETTSSPEDTWKYTLDGDILTLPKSRWFLRCWDGTDDRFLSAQLPNVKGHIKSVDKNEPLSFSDKIQQAANSAIYSDVYIKKDWAAAKTGKNGGAYNNIKFDAHRYNSIYSDTATTVMPNSTGMYIYFYVGRPSGGEE